MTTIARLSCALQTLSLALVLCAWMPAPAQEQIRPAYTAEFVAQMLDYVSRDYVMAVSNGKVIDQDEYEEQLVVCRAALEVAGQIQSLVARPAIGEAIVRLMDQIKAKAPVATIKQQALSTRDAIFAASGAALAPVRWPDQVRGKQVFDSNCASCHGLRGDGHGRDAPTLTPRPANFLDPNRMQALAPRSAYGTIKMGIAGTAMPAYPQLTDDDLWAVSFYVVSLRQRALAHTAGRIDPTAASMWLTAAATLPDDELMKALPGGAGERKKLLALLRLYSE